jgi:hypothetical protein
VIAESLGWLTPAPLWDQPGFGLESDQLRMPFLVELKSDQFVDEFLTLMGVGAAKLPACLHKMAPEVTNDAGSYRLFQPLSQRYYLVTASLVCRRVGIPDRVVRPAQGERTSFVVRRLLADETEQAWVPAAGGWQTASGQQLSPGEEQLPMHPVPVTPFATPGSTAATFGMTEPGRRTVHYGYIATGRRERMVQPLTDADAVADLLAIDPAQQQLVLVGDLQSRVIQPWALLQGASTGGPPPAGTDTDYSSLYVLLDLGDWLQTNLSNVYQALTVGPALRGSSAAYNLYAALANKKLEVGSRPAPPVQPPPPGWTPAAPAPVTLQQALHDLRGYAALVTGGSVSPLLTTSYDLMPDHAIAALPANWLADSSTAGSLANLALLALAEANVPLTVPSELSGMIKADPPVAPQTKYGPDTYVIRAVFEHPPCVPVLSDKSGLFQLARVLDGDAPARQIRIALPDISNLRQFQRGVAIEMPPSLRRVLDRVNPGMLQGNGLGSDPGVELGMICGFSIQVMWVLSFIVMFLFAIAFNLIFWWLPFLKICFPVPVPSQPQNGNPAP